MKQDGNKRNIIIVLFWGCIQIVLVIDEFLIVIPT